MDKQFTYSFLREELLSISNRQDTLLSIAYATVIALWTIALTINNEWIAIIPVILLIPFSLKTYDLRYGASFIASYMKICLEKESCNGWETIRGIYYQQGFSRSLKHANIFSKFSYFLLTIGSCAVFWLIYILVLGKEFFIFRNGIIIAVQIAIILFQGFILYKFSTIESHRKELEKNWVFIKEKYINP